MKTDGCYGRVYIFFWLEKSLLDIDGSLVCIDESLIFIPTSDKDGEPDEPEGKPLLSILQLKCFFFLRVHELFTTWRWE